MEVRPHSRVHAPRARGVRYAVVPEPHPDGPDKDGSAARGSNGQARDSPAPRRPSPEGDGGRRSRIVVDSELVDEGGRHGFQVDGGVADAVRRRRSQAGGNPWCTERGRVRSGPGQTMTRNSRKATGAGRAGVTTSLRYGGVGEGIYLVAGRAK